MSKDKNLNLRLTADQLDVIEAYMRENKLKDRTVAGMQLIHDGLIHNGKNAGEFDSLGINAAHLEALLHVNAGKNNNSTKLSAAMGIYKDTARKILNSFLSKGLATVGPPMNGKIPLVYKLTVSGKKLIEGVDFESIKEKKV